MKAFILILLFGQFLSSLLFAVEPVSANASIGLDRTTKPWRLLVQIIFTPKDDPESLNPILNSNSSALNKENYVLRQGTKTVPIKDILPTPTDAGGKRMGGVNIVPGEVLKGDAEYCVEIKAENLTFAPGYHLENVDCASVDQDELKATLDFVNHRELKNKFELLSGSNFAAGSFHYTYNYDSPINDYPQWFHAEAEAKADFDFKSTDRTKYFNSIQAQTSVFYVNEFKSPWDEYGSPYYIGGQASIESDQSFENMDVTAGLQLRTYFKNPLTNLVYAALVHGKAKEEPGVKPRFELGYKYVGHLAEDDASNTGSQRLVAGFSWWLPFLRQVSLQPIVTDRVLDGDILIDAGFIYDVEGSQFTDTTKISLDLHWPKTGEKSSDKDPSFVLTYANGKAAPKFEHFDAFLAGVKLPF